MATQRKLRKLDPARLKAALEAPRPDPLDPRMVAIVKDIFKPEVAARYVKSWKARKAAKKR